LDDDLLIDWISSLDVKNATESDILEVEKYALMLNEGIWKVGELLKKFVVVLQELKISEEERSKYAAEFSLLNALFNKLKKTMAN